MVGLVHAIETEIGATVDELNLGGGLGVRYLPDDAPPTIEQYATVVRDSVGKALADAGVRSRPRLLTEPGRSIVAPAGITLYTVGTIKAIDGIRTYVAVDGGMSDNLRPVTYGARYEAFLPARATAERSALVTIAGKHCEQGDIIVRDTLLPADLAIGEVLATPVTGAYGHSMASNYNKVTRPGGRVRARRRRPGSSCGARPKRTWSGSTPTRSLRRVASPAFPGVAIVPGATMSSTLAADARLAAVAVDAAGVFTRAQALGRRVRRRRRSSGACAPAVWVRVLPARVPARGRRPHRRVLVALGRGAVGRARRARCRTRARPRSGASRDDAGRRARS